jgi:IS30 family transposase
MLKETQLPVKSIMTGNGTVFAAHEIIAKKLNTGVYFVDLYS